MQKLNYFFLLALGLLSGMVVSAQTTVEFSTATATISEFQAYTITVNVTNPSASVPLVFEINATGGTATNGSDYSWLDTTVTIPANLGGSFTFSLGALDDQLMELTAETVVLSIQNVSGGTAGTVGTNGTLTITINDYEDSHVSQQFPAMVVSETRVSGAQYVEIIVNEDDLDARGWRVGRANNDATGTPSTFNTIVFANHPLWEHLRRGTVIVIQSQSGASPDTDASDGYIRLNSNDATYFSTTALFSWATNCGAAKIWDPTNAHVHGMAWKSSCGGTQFGITTGNGLSRNIFLSGTYPSAQVRNGGYTNFTAGNLGSGGSGSALRYDPASMGTWNFGHTTFWRKSKQPVFAQQKVGAATSAGTNSFTWATAPDPNPTDGLTGYIVLRNTTNTFPNLATAYSLVYTVGQIVSGAEVVGILNHDATTGSTIGFSDTPPVAGCYFYRVYAFRYNGTTSQHGRHYSASFVEVVPQEAPPTASFTTSANIPRCAGVTAPVTMDINLTGTPPFTISYTIGGIAQTPIVTSSNPYTLSFTPASTPVTVALTAITDAGSCGSGALIFPTARTVTTPTGGSNWTGVVSADWFDPANWTNCVPTCAGNVTIVKTGPFDPVIDTTSTFHIPNSGPASANSVTVQANNQLILAADDGALTVCGTLTIATGSGAAQVYLDPNSTMTVAGGVTIQASGSSANPSLLEVGAGAVATLGDANSDVILLSGSNSPSFAPGTIDVLANGRVIINGDVSTNTNYTAVGGTINIANGAEVYLNGDNNRFFNSSRINIASGGSLFLNTSAFNTNQQFYSGSRLNVANGGNLHIGSAAGQVQNLFINSGSGWETAPNSHTYIEGSDVRYNNYNGVLDTFGLMTLNMTNGSSLFRIQNGSLRLNNVLTLNRGVITTTTLLTNNVYQYFRGAGAIVPSATEESWINGALLQYLDNTTAHAYELPVGTATHVQRATVDFNTTPSGGLDHLLAFFIAGPASGSPAYPWLSPVACGGTQEWDWNLNNGYWTVFGSGSANDFDIAAFSSANYDLTLYNRGYTNAGVAHTILKKDFSAANYSWTGSCGNTSATATSRAGFSGFSEFQTIVADDIVLPVELLAFAAEPLRPGSALLTWTTANEQNNAGFTVERSFDGTAFEDLGWVQGNGTTNAANDYTFTDNGLASAVQAFYRLRQQDFDGNTQYSQIREVNFGTATSANVLAYPNPATDQLTVELSGAAEATVKLFNAVGQVVRSAVVVGTETIDLSGLAAGTYALQATVHGNVLTERIVKR